MKKYYPDKENRKEIISPEAFYHTSVPYLFHIYNTQWDVQENLDFKSKPFPPVR